MRRHTPPPGSMLSLVDLANARVPETNAVIYERAQSALNENDPDLHLGINCCAVCARKSSSNTPVADKKD